MNISTPIVSVVVPMYNVEKYIRQCIESVLAQTYSYFEVICVDDGCTDNTLDILNEFNDARIRLVQQENQGLAAARNTGINEARGIYVALLDSDDFWAPEKLEKHVRHLEKNPSVGISFSPSVLVDDNGKDMGLRQTPKLKNISTKDILCRNPVGNGSAPVMRRGALLDIGVINLRKKQFFLDYFDPNLRQSEDLECWLRMSLNTKWRFEGIPEALTFYRINGSGLSANTEKQFLYWKKAINNNRNGNEDFFHKWFTLAQAYQKRYFARRAVQSNNAFLAIRLLAEAVFSSPRILLEEPGRTVTTLACALFRFLPNVVYNSLFRLGIGINKCMNVSCR